MFKISRGKDHGHKLIWAFWDRILKNNIPQQYISYQRHKRIEHLMFKISRDKDHGHKLNWAFWDCILKNNIPQIYSLLSETTKNRTFNVQYF